MCYVYECTFFFKNIEFQLHETYVYFENVVATIQVHQHSFNTGRSNAYLQRCVKKKRNQIQLDPAQRDKNGQIYMINFRFKAFIR